MWPGNTYWKSVLGVILADQIKSLDWKSREAEFGCDVPIDVVNLVLEKLSPLLSSFNGETVAIRSRFSAISFF